MKLCNECGTKNLNSAEDCESCHKPIKTPERMAGPTEHPDAEYQKKVLLALERLARLEDSPRKIDLSLINLSLTDMAWLYFKIFIAGIPFACAAFIVAIGLSFVGII